MLEKDGGYGKLESLRQGVRGVAENYFEGGFCECYAPCVLNEMGYN